MKKYWSILVIIFLTMLMHTGVYAQNQSNLKIEIISPSEVNNIPGYETNVVAKITNVSSKPLDKVMVYITMMDIGKHWTVNLEDYGADQPLQIGTLKSGEIKEIQLPIRFVYTSQYKVYVTASSDVNQQIYSSDAIFVKILGNTKINPALVQSVSLGVPSFLFVGLMTRMLKLNKKKNDKNSEI